MKKQVDPRSYTTHRDTTSVIVPEASGNVSINGKVGQINMDQLLKLLADMVKIN